MSYCPLSNLYVVHRDRVHSSIFMRVEVYPIRVVDGLLRFFVFRNCSTRSLLDSGVSYSIYIEVFVLV